ncbi:hypothetical protein FOL47_011128 [Perkinsus chesapeaki]|uniref:Uncharacterized protein n=1 Tax=Perkinsus chesapeaki TaxID=330153 RepID=A0A7J6KZP6_PERCH|nr:hypothetical protein FOL47_011128 [Perkinsus chesapeaki]
MTSPHLLLLLLPLLAVQLYLYTPLALPSDAVSNVAFWILTAILVLSKLYFTITWFLHAFAGVTCLSPKEASLGPSVSLSLVPDGLGLAIKLGHRSTGISIALIAFVAVIVAMGLVNIKRAERSSEAGTLLERPPPYAPHYEDSQDTIAT